MIDNRVNGRMYVRLGDYLKKLQFPIIEGSLTLIDLSKKMLHFTQNLNDLVSNVIGLLQTKFPSLIVNQKLSNWYELEKTENTYEEVHAQL